MSQYGRTHAVVLPSVLLAVGIIHFGVGIGIDARYRKFGDTFQQQVSLAGYNIFIGICTIAVGILGLTSAISQSPFLTRVTSLASFVLGIFVLVSLITALALSGSAASYLHDSIINNMNKYGQDQDAIDVIDQLQRKYQCCGVNLWLDWARVSLGASNGINIGRRRRQPSSVIDSSLSRVLREKRQIITQGNGIYNLPSSYSINLPLSCCTAGGTAISNSLGGYCIFNANNSTSSFYIRGCLEPIANIGFSQITGIAVINTCLMILAFVYFGKLMATPRNTANQDDRNNQHPILNEISQSQQQYPYGPYYMNYDKSSPYYIPTDPTYKMYL